MSDKIGWIQFPDMVKLELHSQPAEPEVEMPGKHEQQPIVSDKAENWIEFPDGLRLEYNVLSAPQTLQLPPPSQSFSISDAGGRVATAEDRVNSLAAFSFYMLEEANKKLHAEHAALEIKLADANGRITSLEAELADLKPKPVPAPIAPIHAAIRAKPAFGGLRCIFE